METDAALMYKKVEYVIGLIVQKKITAYRLSEDIKHCYGENIYKMSLHNFANSCADMLAPRDRVSSQVSTTSSGFSSNCFAMAVPMVKPAE